MEISQMKEKLMATLNPHRYEHTLGVSYTAVCLAMKYDVDLKKAEIAGLLHDSAKCIPDSEKIQLCEENSIEITEIEREQPQLLHAKLGAFIAKRDYDITNEEILSSIVKHTTGSENMTMLEKIIYVADYIEPGRDKAKHLKEIRKMAFTDIDAAIFMIMRDTIEYLKISGSKIDKLTLIAYDYYKK